VEGVHSRDPPFARQRFRAMTRAAPPAAFWTFVPTPIRKQPPGQRADGLPSVREGTSLPHGVAGGQCSSAEGAGGGNGGARDVGGYSRPSSASGSIQCLRLSTLELQESRAERAARVQWARGS
jgi:hypothetical protein